MKKGYYKRTGWLRAAMCVATCIYACWSVLGDSRRDQIGVAWREWAAHACTQSALVHYSALASAQNVVHGGVQACCTHTCTVS